MMLARKLVKGCWALGLLLVGLLLGGCETLQTGANQAATQSTGSSTGPDLTRNFIQEGDKLLIEFSDINPPLNTVNTTVRTDGTITLPHNLIVVAKGKTWGELANEIHQKYVPATYRRLTVNVRGEDRYYTVTGMVRSPGPKTYMGQITTLKAIAAAGDFTEFAKKTNIQITRTNGKKDKVNAKKALKDPSLDLPVYPGDIVHVDRRFW